MAVKPNKSQTMKSSATQKNRTIQEMRRIQSKRGPALDEEMSRRIAAVNVPSDARAQHAAAMVLTRALRSVPEKFRGALDDLILAMEDENETWIYDCLMLILKKAAGQPINPRHEENDEPPPGKGKIISLIPGETLADSAGEEIENEEIRNLKNKLELEIDSADRRNLQAMISWRMAANKAAQA